MYLKKVVYPLFLLAILLAFWSGLSIVRNINNNEVLQTQSTQNPLYLSSNPAFAQTKGNASYADVVEKCIAGVVNIYSTRIIHTQAGDQQNPLFDDPFFKRFFGPDIQPQEPSERKEQSLGSGVIVGEEGIILTNNHVVADAKELKVTLYDSREFDAEVVGTDASSDIAVIRLKEKVKGLKPLPLGNSDLLRLGDTVIAIGNPFGLNQTVTMGIVSAKGRSGMGIEEYEDFIQTDAAINPGNSGGALINMNGELIGINTAILSDPSSYSPRYQGIGFAIPSNMANVIMKQLIEKGKVSRGWLGVNIQNVDKSLADAMGLSTTQGALVSDVQKNTPAQKAGLKSGDFIIQVNGEKINDINDLRNKIAILGPDTTASLTIIRDGKESVLTVKLGELPVEEKVASREGRRGTEKDSELYGLAVVPLNQTNRANYKIPDEVTNGVIVSAIQSGSPAEEAGLQPGDVIREINRKSVDSVEMFASEYKKSKGSIPIKVYRQGSNFYRALKK